MESRWSFSEKFDCPDSLRFNCLKQETVELYNCDRCEMQVFSKVNLKLHEDIYHKYKSENEQLTTSQLYLICNAKYNITEILKAHNCDNCDFRTFSVIVLLKHRVNGCSGDAKVITEEEQVEEDYFQPILNIFNRKRRKLIQKIMQFEFEETTNRFFKCNHCNYKSKSKHYILCHINSLHKSDEEAEWFHCVYCNYKTKIKSYLAKHNKNKHAITIEWLSCDQCGFKARNKAYLSNHKKEKHSEPEFLCELCAYRCHRKNRFEKHQLTH